MSKVYVLDCDVRNGDLYYPVPPDWDKIVSAGFTHVYICAAIACRDNPLLSQTYDEAIKRKLGVGYFITLKDDPINSWGKQIVDLAAKLKFRAFALPPAVVFTGETTRSPHQIRGDLMYYFKTELVDKFPVIAFGANRSSLEKLFAVDPNPNLKGGIEEARAIMAKTKLWLYAFTQDVPTDVTPWSSVFLWSHLVNGVLAHNLAPFQSVPAPEEPAPVPDPEPQPDDPTPSSYVAKAELVTLLEKLLELAKGL